ncbi:hypothetical protein GCM10027347_44870 [Larkinella harenae]
METVITAPKTSDVQILNPKDYSTKEDYAVAMGFPKETGWTEICETLGLELDPKGGRRTLYNAFKAQANIPNEGEGKIEKKSVSVTVPASTITVIDQPQPVKEAEATEEVAEVKGEPFEIKEVKRKKAAPAPVVEEGEDDEVTKAARMFAEALAKAKGRSPELNPEQIQKMVNDNLRSFRESVDGQIQELREENEVALPHLVTKIVELKLQDVGVTRIEVKLGDKEAKEVKGKTHKEFKNLLQHAAIRDNVMLVGPAGSGKTTVCQQVAEALELAFYCKSVCAQTSKAELLGYCDANGNYVTTEFRKAFEDGGLFVLDEVDAGNPNVIAVLNSALANEYCAFADKMVKKHEDFVLIACANTFGLGADRQYVGRNQLDAATLDRFSVIEFAYDETLERDLAPNKWFCNFTQKLRKELVAERVVISPRATILGGRLIEAGFSPEYALKTRVLKGMPVALAERVQKVFGTFYNERAAKGLELPNQTK